MNVRKNIYTIIGVLVVMMSESCSRDHLYYDTVSRDKVQLNIDWSETAFAPGSRDYDDDNRLNGVTVFAFDSATHRLVKELPPDPNWQSTVIRLDPGTYDFIVINDSRAELPTISFNTGQPFDDFYVSTEGDTVYTNCPDYLAVSAVKGVTFLPEQREYCYDMPDGYYRDYIAQKLYTVQHAVTKKINIRVLVKGMNYCKGMQASYITGLSKSANLSTGKAGTEETVYAFNLINREFRNSEYTEALLTQSFNSFGFNENNLREGTKFELTLNFVLVDNTLHTVTTDVTPQFEEWLEEHSIDLGLDLDLNIDIALEVELPPAVENPEDVEGLAPETVPWNDITQIIEL